MNVYENQVALNVPIKLQMSKYDTTSHPNYSHTFNVLLIWQVYCTADLQLTFQTTQPAIRNVITNPKGHFVELLVLSLWILKCWNCKATRCKLINFYTDILYVDGKRRKYVSVGSIISHYHFYPTAKKKKVKGKKKRFTRSPPTPLSKQSNISALYCRLGAYRMA